ncbi:MAG: hypothetical protein Q3999_01320 [Buchananella hordeovulneris]|nr:hypothetical protein [Buchananella hordeovulneris]
MFTIRAAHPGGPDQTSQALAKVEAELAAHGARPLAVQTLTQPAGLEVALDAPALAAAVVRELLALEGVAVGVGVGPQEQAPKQAQRALAAASKRTATRPVVVAARNKDGAHSTTILAQALAALVQGRTALGHEAVAAMRHHPDRASAAAQLGITTQALSQRLRTANQVEANGLEGFLTRGLTALEALTARRPK